MTTEERSKWTCCMYDRKSGMCRALRCLACDDGRCRFHRTANEARAARYKSLARRIALGYPVTEFDAKEVIGCRDGREC